MKQGKNEERDNSKLDSHQKKKREKEREQQDPERSPGSRFHDKKGRAQRKTSWREKKNTKGTIKKQVKRKRRLTWKRSGLSIN